ncbi:hypothetical protein HIM_04419 [Hirsutella minnesotensis 3608]|uniref:SWIM-type domain-containing protein n=1 Tax=Hirsutella minnesotensis 3608 TaxID=1043627 RepID=A0A0F8A1M4_9HYPO|nr:hypothetical protein HIM_04419 [Hirsutella minnesotensis 3608]
MPLFPSLHDAVKALEHHARPQGYAVIKYKPSNYRGGKPRRMDIACACGGRKYHTIATGLRKAGTRKTACPFRVKVVQLDDDNGLWRVVVMLNAEDQFEYQFIGLDDGLKLVSRHPQLLMADVTNNTNKYGLKLLEINGLTSLGTVFPVACCFVPREDVPAFTWCFEQLKNWVTGEARARQLDDDAFIPHVIITDYDAAARAALTTTFPDSQLQVCTWHIIKNVATYARRHWQGDGNDDPFEPEPQRRETHSDDPGRWSGGPGERSPGEFVTAFKSVLHAPTEEEFDDRWNALIAGFPAQPRLIQYLEETWLPVRKQWARAWTRWYRNWGHTTTSPCESLHASSRSFIRNSQSNLLAVYHALRLQRTTVQEHHDRAVEREAIRTRDPFRLPLYNKVSEKASYRSLELVQKQARAATASLLYPEERALPECTNSFTSQYGLPCKHIIASFLAVEGDGPNRRVTTKEALPLAFWDNHWLLRDDLADTDPYRRIRDPRVVARRRGTIRVATTSSPTTNNTSSRASRSRSQQQQLQRSTAPRRRLIVPPEVPQASQASRSVPLPDLESAGMAAQATITTIVKQLETIQNCLGISNAELKSSRPPADITIEQSPIEPRSYRQPRSFPRSARATQEMRRLPSAFEEFEPTSASQGGARRGYRERARQFTLNTSSKPLSNALPSIQGGFGQPQALEPANTVAEGAIGHSPSRRRGAGALRPYESVWEL